VKPGTDRKNSQLSQRKPSKRANCHTVSRKNGQLSQRTRSDDNGLSSTDK